MHILRCICEKGLMLNHYGPHCAARHPSFAYQTHTCFTVKSRTRFIHFPNSYWPECICQIVRNLTACRGRIPLLLFLLLLLLEWVLLGVSTYRVPNAIKFLYVNIYRIGCLPSNMTYNMTYDMLYEILSDIWHVLGHMTCYMTYAILYDILNVTYLMSFDSRRICPYKYMSPTQLNRVMRRRRTFSGDCVGRTWRPAVLYIRQRYRFHTLVSTKNRSNQVHKTDQLRMPIHNFANVHDVTYASGYHLSLAYLNLQYWNAPKTGSHLSKKLFASCQDNSAKITRTDGTCKLE